MNPKWKDEIKSIPRSVLEPLAKVVCEQTCCMGDGYIEAGAGQCALCADTAESVVGEFLWRMREIEQGRGEHKRGQRQR